MILGVMLLLSEIFCDFFELCDLCVILSVSKVRGARKVVPQVWRENVATLINLYCHEFDSSKADGFKGN